MMRTKTVRFSDQLWLAVQQEADLSGVSASAFIREATIARIAYSKGLRGETADATVAALRERMIRAEGDQPTFRN